MLEPHVSAMSHCPTSARHSKEDALSWQVELQQLVAVPLAAPASHCSPWAVSVTPFPQQPVGPVQLSLVKVPDQALLLQVWDSEEHAVPQAGAAKANFVRGAICGPGVQAELTAAPAHLSVVVH